MSHNDQMLRRPGWPRNPGHAIEFGTLAEIAGRAEEPTSEELRRLRREIRPLPEEWESLKKNILRVRSGDRFGTRKVFIS